MPDRTDYRLLEATYAQTACFASLMAPVIEAAALEEGGCEFLAVVPLTADAAAPAGSSIRAQQLPLPYELPA